jgi:hypothetical protein
VLDFRGHRHSDDHLAAAPNLMERLRYSVILIIVAALAGGIWARSLSTSEGQAASPAEVHSLPENSGLQVTGTFDVPVGGLSGFEISVPNCAHPLAVLPVPTRLMTIIPTEYRYQQGEYDISYVYNGNVYPEAWINYRLGLLSIFYRIKALFDPPGATQFAYYLKIWTPSSCRGISNAEASALERALAGPVGRKDV